VLTKLDYHTILSGTIFCMHRHILILSTATLYFTIAAYTLYLFDAGLIATSVVLFGIPAFLFAHYSAAPFPVLISVATFAAGVAILLEGIAHIYGLWYVPGVEIFRLFDLIPLEMVFAVILKILFLSLLYEFLFDDGEYSVTNARTRFTSFGMFALATLLLFAAHYFIFKSFIFPNAYYWVTVLFVLASLSMVFLHKTLSLRLLNKLTLFAVLAAVPLFIGEVLAVLNGHKLYESIYQPVSLPFIEGIVLPFGEFLLIFSLPFFVAAVYELYIDDRM